jgi:threonine/homoserine/homoserine lactone efflux protein
LHAGVVALLRSTGFHTTWCARRTLFDHVVFIFFVVVILFFLANHASARLRAAAWQRAFNRYRSVVVVVCVIWTKTQVIHGSSKH